MAKELHAGHLRATVVGDSIVRVLEYLGHTVIRAAHLGDWGTQFGMLIEHALDIGEEATADQLAAGEFTAFYQAARAKFDAGAAFAGRSRQRVVELQSGDEQSLRLWQTLVSDSMEYLREVYARLGVTLTDADMDPESFYNPMLAAICAELEDKGIAVISDGALCAFPPGFAGRDGAPVPLMLRKSDGGYGYASTDVAAIRYRLLDLHADRIIYVVGSEQHQHLEMVFAVAAMAGWLTSPATAEHAVIGLMTGPGGARLRTRSGDQITLVSLIDEAVERAEKVITDRYDDPEFRQPDRRAGRRGRAEVRGPVGGPQHQLRPGLRPAAGPHREHRPLPAVRHGPHPLHLPPGRPRPGRGGRARSRWPSRPSGRWPCACSASGARSATSPSRPSRTSWRDTCSRWRAPSPRSTSSARC